MQDTHFCQTLCEDFLIVRLKRTCPCLHPPSLPSPHHLPTVPSPRLSFRCSARDASRARRRAAREGVPLAVALRALLSDWAAGRRPSIAIARTHEALFKELHAIGVNLNQAARALNSGRYPSDLVPIVRRLAVVTRRLRQSLDRFYTAPHRP